MACLKAPCLAHFFSYCIELNQDKFELLQLGQNPDRDLKHPYTLPSGQEILGSNCVKDPELSWKEHISKKVENWKAKVMASWVLRTYPARDTETLLLLYKTYVRTD